MRESGTHTVYKLSWMLMGVKTSINSHRVMHICTIQGHRQWFGKGLGREVVQGGIGPRSQKGIKTCPCAAGGPGRADGAKSNAGERGRGSRLRWSLLAPQLSQNH